MRERIRLLVANRSAPRRPIRYLAGLPTSYEDASQRDATISAHLVVRRTGSTLPDCLAHIRPWVHEVFVIFEKPDHRFAEIAREYGCAVIDPSTSGVETAKRTAASKASANWLLQLYSDELLPETTGRTLEKVLANIPEKVRGLRCEIRNRLNNSSRPPAREVRIVRNCRDTEFDWHTIGGLSQQLDDVLDVDVEIVATTHE